MKKIHPEVDDDDPTRLSVYEDYLKRGENAQHGKLAQNLKGTKRGAKKGENKPGDQKRRKK